MGYTVRELGDDDAADYAALAAAIETDHPTGFQLSAAEFLEIRHDVGAVVLGAFNDDDTLVGSTLHLVSPPHADGQSVLLGGDVHPDHLGRGLGTLLAERVLDAARLVHREQAPDVPATYAIRSVSGRASAAGVLQALGFSAERYRFMMAADLAGAPSPPELPPGYELVGFDPAEHSAVLLAAHNAAFAGYPNHHDASEEEWRRFMIEPAHVRHHLSWWARHHESGEPAAYVFSHEYAIAPSGRAAAREAYVPYVGTLPGHRGRGLAGALLRQAMSSAQADGCDSASLEVDTENPTGALRIYEAAGFAVVSRFDEWFLRE
jgi:ribosomal protein S18 acetylase RimI-like enzyme